MQYVLIDTGVWYAMFDPRDQHQAKVAKKQEILELFTLVIPWPTMYETLRTRMVRNRQAMYQIEDYLKRPNLTFLDDSPYREKALELAFSSSLRKFRQLSMIDCLLRLILEDDNVMINYLATFNDEDFLDVCHARRIAIF